MLKIMVIGSPGAGKSTFARKLRNITGLRLYYLDMLWHKPDKTNISEDEFDMRLKEIVKKDNWIIDGNYLRTLELRLKECDTVFLLDFPPEVCLSGAKSRIGKKREDLPWMESELDEELYKLLEKYEKDRKIVIFKSRKEADDYLKTISN